MKLTKSSLVAVLALALGTTSACAPAADSSDGTGSTGGSTGNSSGGKSGTGGSTSTGTGGSSSTGGSTGTGGVASSGGTTGTGGSSDGGSTGSGGSSATGGSSGMGGDSGDTAAPADMAGGETGGPPAGGKMVITIDSDPVTSTPDHLCFKKEASNSGGNHSPKIDWNAPPAGTMSLVLMMEDLSNMVPHRIVCNMKPTETGQAADIKMMVPAGAMVGTGHGKPGNPWYGPGAGAPAHKYEITIFALATPMLQGGCGPGAPEAKAARTYLKTNIANKAVVLDHDSKILWGDVNGNCK